jgi:hypothetical protein
MSKNTSRSHDARNSSSKLSPRKPDYLVWDTVISGFLEEIESN